MPLIRLAATAIYAHLKEKKRREAEAAAPPNPDAGALLPAHPFNNLLFPVPPTSRDQNSTIPTPSGSYSPPSPSYYGDLASVATAASQGSGDLPYWMPQPGKSEWQFKKGTPFNKDAPSGGGAEPYRIQRGRSTPSGSSAVSSRFPTPPPEYNLKYARQTSSSKSQPSRSGRLPTPNPTRIQENDTWSLPEQRSSLPTTPMWDIRKPRFLEIGEDDAGLEEQGDVEMGGGQGGSARVDR